MERDNHPPQQISFLGPQDSELVHMMRRLVADADRIYKVRTGRGLTEPVSVTGPGDVYEYLRGEMAELDQEQLRVLTLSVKNKIISARLIYQGTLSGTHVRVAEVFRPAIVDCAASIIVVHNHPSGDPAPSGEDTRITQQIVEAGKLLDIDVLDHIVIGADGFASMRERGLGFGS